MSQTFRNKPESTQKHDQRQGANQAQLKRLQQTHATEVTQIIGQSPALLQAEELGEEDVAEAVDTDELELIEDDYDEGEEGGDEPADSNGEECHADSFELPLPPLQNPALIAAGESYWLIVTIEQNGTARCRFRPLSWRGSNPARIEAFNTIKAVLTLLAAWLEQKGQAFLREPTAKNYVEAQGDQLKLYWDKAAIVTVQGLLMTILSEGKVIQDENSPLKRASQQLLGEKALVDVKQDKVLQNRFSKILDRTWLIWPQQQALALKTLLEDHEYKCAWVMQGLAVWEKTKKTQPKWCEYSVKADKDSKENREIKTNARHYYNHLIEDIAAHEIINKYLKELNRG